MVPENSLKGTKGKLVSSGKMKKLKKKPEREGSVSSKEKESEKKMLSDHVVGLKPGKGWHHRNFLSEVLIPSALRRTRGARLHLRFPKIREDQICITWIGHASFLVQTREHNILIDPNWAKWLKVVKRVRNPGIALDHLPEIDLVLVTHAHFDHLDKRSLKAVAAQQPIIVPHNVGNLVHRLGFGDVLELNPWQVCDLGSLKITMTPARHWGARVLHDRHRGFGGFLIEYHGRTVFHCGDTSYFSGFEEMGERLNVEVALLPIGAYDAPSARDVHMNPEEALKAFVELKAKTLVPMHFGTFRLSYEPLYEPPIRLLEQARKEGLEEKIRILTEGVPTIF